MQKRYQSNLLKQRTSYAMTVYEHWNQNIFSEQNISVLDIRKWKIFHPAEGFRPLSYHIIP